MKLSETDAYPYNGAVRRFFLVMKLLAILSAVAAGGSIKG